MNPSNILSAAEQSSESLCKELEGVAEVELFCSDAGIIIMVMPILD